MSKRALVCGAGGFIGSHLVDRLKLDGYWVRGVDLKYPEFGIGKADDFKILDLREPENCKIALDGHFDEVYQLATDMGGVGFTYSADAECDTMRNNVLINTNMIYASTFASVNKYFFSSSVCVYRDMAPNEPELNEADVYPAHPHNEYGWEKLYSERLITSFGKRYHIPIRIARFQNCYGPYGTWTGGREKSPAALCRKVAQASPGDEVEVWGDGTAIRSYIFIGDLLNGIRDLMDSHLSIPVNIGCPERITIDELTNTIIKVSGKRDLKLKHISGPEGVKSRNFSNKLISTIGWKPTTPLAVGLGTTYHWIETQVKNSNE
jgi:GDP-D-mannose 3', 5'-epimerase